MATKKKKEAHSFEELKTWKDERDANFNSSKQIKKKPLTDNHNKYLESIRKNEITFVVGPAGTLKTYLAAQVACELLKANKIDKIVICRPLITAGEELGILPGDLKEKVLPYLTPLIDNIKEIVGDEIYFKWEKEEKIEIEPLAIMRGKTFHNSFVILDEGQNATWSQLKLFLTRIGQNSKLVINGDVEQSDLHSGFCPLQEIWRRLIIQPRNPNIGFCMMNTNDIVRSEIVKFIAERLAGKLIQYESKSEEKIDSNNLKFYKR